MIIRASLAPDQPDALIPIYRFTRNNVGLKPLRSRLWRETQIDPGTDFNTTLESICCSEFTSVSIAVPRLLLVRPNCCRTPALTQNTLMLYRCAVICRSCMTGRVKVKL